MIFAEKKLQKKKKKCYEDLKEKGNRICFLRHNNVSKLLSCAVYFRNYLAMSSFWKRAKLLIKSITSKNTSLIGYIFFLDLISSLSSSIISASMSLVFSMVNWCTSSSSLDKDWMKVATSWFVAMKVLVIGPSGARLGSRALNSQNTSVSYVNGSSLSWVEINWLHVKIPTFLKPLMMVVSASVNHACSSIMMESSMVVFGNSSLKSIVLMCLRITLRISFDYYLAFKDHITFWFI